MTTAATLLTELRQMGATVSVAGYNLRIEAPDGTVTPELRQLLTEHKSELLALLSRTLPAADPRRLDVADCLGLLDDLHTGIRAEYEPRVLGLLDTDPDLRRRFDTTEARIDELARTPRGPTEGDFRAAAEAHGAAWREIIARHGARQERPLPMPELAADTVGAVGFSYGDGEPGTWDVVRHAR
jgi:hypothetical protein